MPHTKPDQRYKFGKVNILIADSDERAAEIVKDILSAFGFRRIDIVTTGEDALKILKTRKVDLLLCEMNLGSVDGLALIRSVRALHTHTFLTHDLPIIMLTGRAGREQVQAARDAGVTEFVAKPFSAQTISRRLIEIIDAPREYIDTPTYKGPNRRRREGQPPPGIAERRLPRMVRERMPDAPRVKITRPNYSLRQQADNVRAADVITPEVVAEAQVEVMKHEDAFAEWVNEYIATLDKTYGVLKDTPENKAARGKMESISYIIKSQSGIFGYEMATQVAELLTSYLMEHDTLSENNFIVIRKHIDTMVVIFNQKLKENNSAEAAVVLDSFNKLIQKFS